MARAHQHRGGRARPQARLLGAYARREAAIVLFRQQTLLPLDDCLYALQQAIPHLRRSALHRCLERHGISRLPNLEKAGGKKAKFKDYPLGYLHLDFAEVRTGAGK
ncbi:hypothetical protein DDQ68_09745 [Hymenobacter nivis]|uniref:Transposase n=1 Tax=Hymenobacter nivis TaxID=1850093 RepID=A0A2Z3GWH5_9BACT|nr:hypothetical protein DDQ68_09745 [Hymenobacter nivis]